jgi:hypothetical protein
MYIYTNYENYSYYRRIPEPKKHDDGTLRRRMGHFF